MNVHLIIADFAVDPHSPYVGLLLPVAVGVFAGMGVVGLIHFVFRRPKPLETPKEQKVADPFTNGSPSEQRTTFRRKGNPIEIQVAVQDRVGPSATGYVVNRSMGGLCIQMDNPLDLETQLTVRPINAPNIAPWVQVVVKNCRRGDIGYDVGCQFVKTPPWPVLMLFG